ncbi:MAG: hypothetical protein RR764_09770, partial [Oscillospiraceae bacterium]
MLYTITSTAHWLNRHHKNPPRSRGSFSPGCRPAAFCRSIIVQAFLWQSSPAMESKTAGFIAKAHLCSSLAL